MNSEHIVHKLVMALDSFTNAEIRKLADMLTDPSASAAISRLLISLISTRLAERNSISKRRRSMQSKRSTTPRSQSSLFMDRTSGLSEKELEVTFRKVLGNRKAFKSTKDVVKTVNDALGFNITYKDFQRRGRRDLISYCWSKLLKLPRSIRMKKLRSFLRNVAKRQLNFEEYQTLFRTLTSHE